MPRGVKKKVNYDEETAKINERISFHENSIKQLKEQCKLLKAQKDDDELKELQTLIKDTGKTAAEFIDTVKANLK